MTGAMVEVDSISHRHRHRGGDVTALTDVSLTIDRGEHVAITGPSGSGKTTLLHLLGLLARPTAGSIRMLDRDCTALSGSEANRFRAAHIGFVFQLFHLVPYLDAIENVIAGRDRLDRDRARQLLDQLGLGERLRHRPGELSVGERQRVAIARALLPEPELILADEPTGNLDPAAEDEVSRALEDYHGAGGTVIVVTHSEPVAARAQRVVRLRDGHLDHE